MMIKILNLASTLCYCLSITLLFATSMISFLPFLGFIFNLSHTTFHILSVQEEHPHLKVNYLLFNYIKPLSV